MNEQSHDLYIDTHLSKCSHDCCGGITTTESSANSSSNSSNSAASLSVFMNEETDKASTAVTTTDTDNDSSFSVPTPLPIIDENSFPHHYFGGNENPDSDLSNNSNNSNNNNVHSNRCLANLSYCNSGDVPGAGGSASHYSNNIIDSNAVATSSLPGAVNSEEVIMITNVLSHPDYDPSFLSGASGTAPNIELPAKAWHLRNHSGIRLNIQQEIQRLVIERTKPEVLMGQEDFTGDVLVDSGSGSGSSISPTEITSTTSTVPTPLESLYDPAYLNSIAEMSAIVENQLYYSAPTLETYCDLSTVPSRISKLLAGILKQYKEASAKAAFEATAGGATAEIKIEAGVEAGVASAASDEDADEGEDSKCAKVTASVCNSSTSNGISPALSAVTAASASTSALASGATAASSAASVALGVNATAPLVNSTVTTAATTTTTATAATEDPDLEFARVLSSLGDGGGVRDRVSDGGDAGIAATRPPVSAPAPTPAISVPVIALTSSDSLTFGRGSESTLISTAGIAGKKPRHGTVKSSTTVSSQGCSRLFIIKVLFTVSDYVKGKHMPSIFTFNRDLVNSWLAQARETCYQIVSRAAEAEAEADAEAVEEGEGEGEVVGAVRANRVVSNSNNSDNTQQQRSWSLEIRQAVTEARIYGGPPFIYTDSSTHWTESTQLYTWWKNNVERRHKFKLLQDDSQYIGPDTRRTARAAWCSAIVQLSEIIRASSGNNCLSNAQHYQAALKKAAAINAAGGYSASVALEAMRSYTGSINGLGGPTGSSSSSNSRSNSNSNSRSNAGNNDVAESRHVTTTTAVTVSGNDDSAVNDFRIDDTPRCAAATSAGTGTGVTATAAATTIAVMSSRSSLSESADALSAAPAPAPAPTHSNHYALQLTIPTADDDDNNNDANDGSLEYTGSVNSTNNNNNNINSSNNSGLDSISKRKRGQISAGTLGGTVGVLPMQIDTVCDDGDSIMSNNEEEEEEEDFCNYKRNGSSTGAESKRYRSGVYFDGEIYPLPVPVAPVAPAPPAAAPGVASAPMIPPAAAAAGADTVMMMKAGQPPFTPPPPGTVTTTAATAVTAATLGPFSGDVNTVISSTSSINSNQGNFSPQSRHQQQQQHQHQQLHQPQQQQQQQQWQQLSKSLFNGAVDVTAAAGRDISVTTNSAVAGSTPFVSSNTNTNTNTNAGNSINTINSSNSIIMNGGNRPQSSTSSSSPYSTSASLQLLQQHHQQQHQHQQHQQQLTQYPTTQQQQSMFVPTLASTLTMDANANATARTSAANATINANTAAGIRGINSYSHSNSNATATTTYPAMNNYDNIHNPINSYNNNTNGSASASASTTNANNNSNNMNSNLNNNSNNNGNYTSNNFSNLTRTNSNSSLSSTTTITSTTTTTTATTTTTTATTTAVSSNDMYGFPAYVRFPHKLYDMLGVENQRTEDGKLLLRITPLGLASTSASASASASTGTGIAGAGVAGVGIGRPATPNDSSGSSGSSSSGYNGGNGNNNNNNANNDNNTAGVVVNVSDSINDYTHGSSSNVVVGLPVATTSTAPVTAITTAPALVPAPIANEHTVASGNRFVHSATIIDSTAPSGGIIPMGHPLHPSNTARTDKLVVRWLPSCKGFQVLDMNTFVESVLPLHFKHNNFTSFQRQLNLYGFKRLRFNAHSNGPETSALLTGVVINGVGGGAGTPGSSAGGSSSTSHSSYKGTYIYSHPLFIFNRRDLCDNIRRVPVTPNGKSKQVQQQQLATVLAFATEGGISGANSEEAGVITDGISITNKSNSITSSSSSKAKDLSNNNTSNNNRNGGSNGNSATMNMINAMNGRRQGETMSMGGQGLSSEGLQLGLGVDNEEGADELYSVLLSMKDFVPSNRVADSSILGSDTTDTTVVSTAMPQQQQQQQQQ